MMRAARLICGPERDRFPDRRNPASGPLGWHMWWVTFGEQTRYAESMSMRSVRLPDKSAEPHLCF
jgi:hypothetical protein